MPRYIIGFDFDEEGAAPNVLIYDTAQRFAPAVIEVFEEPTIKPGRGAWSWEAADWQAGPLATRLLAYLNAQEPA